MWHTFSDYFSLFPFKICHLTCGCCFSLLSFVCIVCILKIFMPSVSSLQFLTLGTRSVLYSFPHNWVSDTGHKCDPLWFILRQWCDWCDMHGICHRDMMRMTLVTAGPCQHNEEMRMANATTTQQQQGAGGQCHYDTTTTVCPCQCQQWQQCINASTPAQWRQHDADGHVEAIPIYIEELVGRNMTTRIWTTPSTRRLRFKLNASIHRFVGTTYIWCTSCGVHVLFDHTLHTTTPSLKQKRTQTIRKLKL